MFLITEVFSFKDVEYAGGKTRSSTDGQDHFRLIGADGSAWTNRYPAKDA